MIVCKHVDVPYNKVESLKNRQTARVTFSNTPNALSLFLCPGIYTVSTGSPWIIFGTDFPLRATSRDRVFSRRSCTSCLVTFAMKIDRVVSTSVSTFLVSVTRVDRGNKDVLVVMPFTDPMTRYNNS